MNINWVLADQVVLDPTVDIDAMKAIGSFWGSWRTWRAYGTDNVICHSQRKANDLIARDFQKTCNFYIHNPVFVALDRPEGVKLYGGNFMDDDVQPEELIAMHLAASASDIILLVGFDWQKLPKNPDKLLEHRAVMYRGLVKQVILDNPSVQWILVDHPGEIHPTLAELSNLSTDTLETILLS